MHGYRWRSEDCGVRSFSFDMGSSLQASKANPVRKASWNVRAVPYMANVYGAEWESAVKVEE